LLTLRLNAVLPLYVNIGRTFSRSGRTFFMYWPEKKFGTWQQWGEADSTQGDRIWSSLVRQKVERGLLLIIHILRITQTLANSQQQRQN
jgi:hypothetical protein